MQIDFHHGTTYVLARLAGFKANEASIIAQSAQYVDDATNSGEIAFSNGASYMRISSAHRTLDYRNFEALSNSRVWIPFHFLPGNGGEQAGADPDGSFIRKLVCRPNSFVAQEMIERAIAARNSPCALHRLGITLHVYADTWAHQGFAGVCHEINMVRNIHDEEHALDQDFITRARGFFGDVFEKMASDQLDRYPLGHGAALSHPDKPFLKWSYTNGLGEHVVRDNPTDFITAAKHLFTAMTQYRTAAGEVGVPSVIADRDLARIAQNFNTFTASDGEVRHRAWCESVAKGDFSFGAETISYTAKGKGSWKHLALNTEEDRETVETFEYNSSFLTSDWKLFHNALQSHRLTVLHDILPRYGICAA